MAIAKSEYAAFEKNHSLLDDWMIMTQIYLPTYIYVPGVDEKCLQFALFF